MGYTIQGKKVGNISFGLMSLTTRPGMEPVPEEQAFAAMKAALATGCNYWNGGEFYGTPEANSLTLLNKYFEKYPEDADKVLLNIKGCLFPPMRQDSSPDAIKTSIENCVRMLGSKHKIDQFEPARKDPKVEIEDSTRTLTKFVESGHIGSVALSEVSASTLRRAAKITKIAAVEIELSLWHTEPFENGLIQACKELDIPILAYGPLGHGFLTGQVKSNDDIPEGDFRKRLPRFQPDAIESNLKFVAELEKLAKKKGCTSAQIAVNWVVALSKRPDMPTIIPVFGSKNAKRVEESAVEIDFTEEDMAEIDRLLKKYPVVGERYHEEGMKILDKS